MSKYIKEMRLIIVLFILFTIKLKAQEPKQKKATTIQSVQLSADSSKQSSPKKTTFEEGTIPTPEEQGYIKKTVDGKEIYYKQSGNLYLEYQPKK